MASHWCNKNSYLIQEAMREEMNVLKINLTWEIVDKP